MKNRHNSYYRPPGQQGFINTYRVLGTILVTAGLALSLFSYFTFPSAPLEGSGVSVMIIGLTTVFLAGSAPPPIGKAGRLLRQTINRLILSLAAAFSGLNAFLILTRENDVSVYFVTNALAFMVVTLAYIGIGRRPRAALNTIATIIFAAFLAIVVLKLLQSTP